MKEVQIKQNYKYLEFDSDISMFAKLDELLKNEYKITETIFLSVELKKEENTVLLNYLPVDKVDENIKRTIYVQYQKHELIYPDYSDTFLSIISEIRRNYGYSFHYPISKPIFDKKYQKVIILLLDGLGENILKQNLKEDSFLNQHFSHSIHAIYPSTTAAATTSIKSGLSPIVTGWTGWENYIKEINKNVILFNGINYFSEEPTGISVYDYLPYSMFYSDMNVQGHCVEPDFTKPQRNIHELLKKSLKINHSSEESIQYVYFTEPDAVMHEYGAYSREAKEVCQALDKEVEAYANALSEDTLLIITADHGHTNVRPIHLYACSSILSLLEREPANDARCITFKVKPHKKEEFEVLFHQLFSSVYKLYKTEEAIRLGFFGLPSDKANPRCKDFLADYVAVGINEYYFNYKSMDDFVFKSHHAGITKEEMLVPVCIVRR